MKYENSANVDSMTIEEVKRNLIEIGYTNKEIEEFNEEELRMLLKDLYKELG